MITKSPEPNTLTLLRSHEPQSMIGPGFDAVTVPLTVAPLTASAAPALTVTEPPMVTPGSMQVEPLTVMPPETDFVMFV